jgi:hypothetical protein
VCAAGEAMNEVIRRPGPGKLHLALAHHGAGGCEFVLVAFDAFAFDQVGDVQNHSAALCQPAAYFFVEGREHPVHLECYGSGAGLALALAGGCLSQLGKILLADAFGRQMFFDFTAAIIHHNFQMHLGFAVKAFEVGLKLALIGSNRFTEPFIILKDSTEAERQNCRLLETVGDHPCVVHSRLLIEGLGWIVFADDYG